MSMSSLASKPKAQPSGEDLRAIDLHYLAEVCETVGNDAMHGLIQSFLHDCRASTERISSSLGRGEFASLSKEAHGLAGMLAQFGCPSAAHAFNTASCCGPDQIQLPLIHALETL
ncbi:MAG: hypothetical protein JWL62_2625 [Hyphomicrobiales bacterium]|nr:hypothetical protein [Hyphomicrobiales bacterium]